MFSIFLPEAARWGSKRLVAAQPLRFSWKQDRQAISAIEKNLSRTQLKARVQQQEVFQFLRRFAGAERFQIIFADPPYEKTKSGERFTTKLLANEALPQLLDADGIFILEKRPGEVLPDMKLWRMIRRKKYGTTEVLFLSGIRTPLSGFA